MKRYSILALALMLGCTIFTGCRRGNGDMMTVPPMTQAATEHYTMPATQPATNPTRPMETESATQDTTGETAADSENTTEGTTGGGQSRARGMDPSRK